MFARLLLIGLDIAGAVLGVAVALVLTEWLKPMAFGDHTPTLMAMMKGPNPHQPPGWILVVAWMFSLRLAGGYSPAEMNAPHRMVAVTFRATLGVFLLMATMHLSLKINGWSRVMMLSYLGASGIIIATSRAVFIKVKPAFSRTSPKIKVGIVGVGERANRLAARLDEYGHDGFILGGYISPTPDAGTIAVPESLVLGCISALPDLVSNHGLKVIILATQSLSRKEQLEVATLVQGLNLHLLEMPNTWGVANPRMAIADLGDLQLLDLTSLAYPTQAERLKRAFDLLAVGVGAIILGPLLLGLAAAVRLSDGGPSLFTQGRAGKGGRRFEMYKFRSMVVNAEKLRPKMEGQNELEGVLFKIEDDPRITPIGRWLRRWSLDEMPQLLNVLKGDMNLVGPRPLPIEDLKGLDENVELWYWFSQRSKVKPGITGTWQITDRHSLKMEDMVRLDIDYIQGWSFFADLAILFKTLPAVIKGRGAR